MLDSMWRWLENLLIEMHAAEHQRQTVSALTQQQQGGKGGKGGGQQQQPHSALPPMVNPHTDHGSPLDAVSNLVDQVTKLRVSIPRAAAVAQAPELVGELRGGRHVVTGAPHHVRVAQAAMSRGGDEGKEALLAIKVRPPPCFACV